jgi:hypothetical protein
VRSSSTGKHNPGASGLIGVNTELHSSGCGLQPDVRVWSLQFSLPFSHLTLSRSGFMSRQPRSGQKSYRNRNTLFSDHIYDLDSGLPTAANQCSLQSQLANSTVLCIMCALAPCTLRTLQRHSQGRGLYLATLHPPPSIPEQG